MLKFLNSTPARVVTILLVAQAALLYSSIRPEAVPAGKPLSSFPHDVGSWTLVQEGLVDAESQAVLQADDTLVRSYAEAGTGHGANLFIAAFRSQRNGKAPHSPKNCLPGNGWTQLEQSTISIDLGAGKPVEANRYIVMHGDNRSLVLYWYQSRDRTVANEFKAKYWVIADAIRYNRTDTALVRVIVPVDNKDTAGAERVATDFVRAFFSTIRSFLPS